MKRVSGAGSLRLIVLAIAMAALLSSRAATAQLSPNGVEFQVNTYTTNYQFGPRVTFDGAGNFVVVWVSDESGGTDHSGYSIQAQRFAGDGSPSGAQFQVNTYTTGNQFSPAVAADATGRFVIVWMSAGSSGTDHDGTSIQAQRYAANGAPSGSQFQVNAYTTNAQEFPAVAADSAGNFIVAWDSRGSSGTDASGLSVQAQRFSATGGALGSQFQVNTYTSNDQSAPSIAADSAGDFVVAWQSEGSPGTDTSYSSVQARRYAANGTPRGAQFQVNGYTSGDQGLPSVASDAQGNFVVAWESAGSAGADTDGLSIHGQRYASDGTPLGSNFEVNTYTTNTQAEATVSADAAGDFVIGWESEGSGGTDTSGDSIHGQRYRANGTEIGGNFQANSYTTGSQQNSAVAVDALGNFVIVWNSPGSSGTDTSGGSIQAQRYDGLFRDGFEAGDVGRWSVVVP